MRSSNEQLPRGHRPMTYEIDERKRWLALTVLCLGVLMIVLDTTIVNVALPSIRADLGFRLVVRFAGLVTTRVSCHWTRLVTLPIGAAVYAGCVALLAAGKPSAHRAKLHVAGAVTGTGSLLLAVYAIVNGNQAGWT